MMNDPNLILPHSQFPINNFLISGSLPSWDQIPKSHQQELILALANLLIQLPQLHHLLEAPDDPQP
jgi:hypothetical protein